MTDLLSLAEACAGTYVAGAIAQWSGIDDSVKYYLSEIAGVHVIAGEGTFDLRGWVQDFDALQAPILDHEKMGPLHRGIAEDALAVAAKIVAYLDGLNWPQFMLTGHSKAAGEVIVLHGHLKALGHAPLATAAFEPPRVGGPQLWSWLAGEPLTTTCTENANGKDLVCLVPPLEFPGSWADPPYPVLLGVPDSYDVPTKHKIPAVIEALQKRAM